MKNKIFSKIKMSIQIFYKMLIYTLLKNKAISQLIYKMMIINKLMKLKSKKQPGKKKKTIKNCKIY